MRRQRTRSSRKILSHNLRFYAADGAARRLENKWNGVPLGVWLRAEPWAIKTPPPPAIHLTPACLVAGKDALCWVMVNKKHLVIIRLWSRFFKQRFQRKHIYYIFDLCVAQETVISQASRSCHWATFNVGGINASQLQSSAPNFD